MTVRIRAGLPLAALAVFAGLGLAARASAEQLPPRPPALVSIGPYGSPFRLVPEGAVFAFEGEAVLTPGVVPNSAHLERDLSTASIPTASKPDEGDPLPAKPGTPGSERAKVPDPVPNQTRKTHRAPPTDLKPDYEVPLGSHAAIGGFSEVGRVQLDTRPGHLPGIRPRDAGGGLTFQYRFGD